MFKEVTRGSVHCLCIWVCLTVLPAWAGPEIIDRPIVYDAERATLMRAYLVAHNNPSQPADPMVASTMAPRMVVIHWTAVQSLEGSFNAFNRVRIRSSRSISAAGAVNVSAHFLIDRGGTIYRLMEETRMGRHTIGLNHVAIGVENVGDGDKWPLTEAQFQANVALIRALVGRHPITHLIGHHEYRRMEGHPYFKELDPRYRTRKSDPGDRFMSRVRESVADLGLKGPPEGERK